MGLAIRKGSVLSNLLLSLAIGLFVISAGAVFLIVRWHKTGHPPPLAHYVLPAENIDETDVPKSKVDSYQVPASQPKYLHIPSIGVSKTRVLSVGTDANNQLASPVNIHDTAWYEDSGTPGSGETILINGHNGGYVRDGVFAKLRELHKGDMIEITRGDNKQFRYQVQEVDTVALKEANSTGMAKMMQSADNSREGLNLITCEGTYSANLQQFDQRVMVRAVLVEP